jgi:hypothetical protein
MTEHPLYVTDGEIAKRMGVGINNGRKALQKMRLHPKFPPKDIGGKRYWPSVRDFLDLWNNRTIDATGNSAGQEQNDNAKTPYRGRAGASLEAAKERLGRRMARAAGHSGGRLQALDAPDRHIHERSD